MPEDQIMPHDFAARILTVHLKNQRVSHAYLFTGDDPAAKEKMALLFAKALNCDDAHSFEECACISCRKMESGNHPDFRILGDDESERSIKIETIRETIAAAALKPYEGKWKVFLVKDAERLTADASNALLKTLEEAPVQTVFLLLTPAKTNLLETIQSRVFEIRFPPCLSGRQAAGKEDHIIPLGFGQTLKETSWEKYLDETGGSRDGLFKALDILTAFFRSRLPGVSPQARESYLAALDILIESKDALDANTNPKLVASRVAMQLRRNLPQGIQ